MLALVQQLALQQLGAPARASSGGRRGRALALRRRRRRRRRLLLPVRLLRPLLASMEQLPQPEHRQPERQQGRPARRRAHHATRGRLLGAAISILPYLVLPLLYYISSTPADANSKLKETWSSNAPLHRTA